jgi:hypothetical protein
VTHPAEHREGTGNQQYREQHSDNRQSFAGRRGRNFGRTLDSWGLVPGSPLDRLDLLVTLGLNTQGMALIVLALFL